MKKLLLILCAVFLLWGPLAVADTMVGDVDPPDGDYLFSDKNPQRLDNSDPALEEVWLEGLLELNVYFYSRDEDSDPDDGIEESVLDDVPDSWIYAVLKYGAGKPSWENPDHWAIFDDGDFLLELGDIPGLPAVGSLSHVSYYGVTPVPEPATMLLLGTGLIGLAGVSRRKFRKS